MLFLDADIDACRIEAGLQPEERNVLDKLHLQSDHEAEEENAFQAMDAVATVEQEYDIHSHSDDQQIDIGTGAHEVSAAAKEEVLSEDDQTDIIRRDSGPQKSENDASSSGRRRSGVSARRRRRTR